MKTFAVELQDLINQHSFMRFLLGVVWDEPGEEEK